MGSLYLLQGIIPTQGSNPGLPHCRLFLYQLSQKGRPRILEYSLSLLQWIFLAQELNQGLLHGRQILYQLNYQGSPKMDILRLQVARCLFNWRRHVWLSLIHSSQSSRVWFPPPRQSLHVWVISSGCVCLKVLVDGTLSVTKIEAHQRCVLLSWVAINQFLWGLASCNGKRGVGGDISCVSACERVRKCVDTQELFPLK